MRKLAFLSRAAAAMVLAGTVSSASADIVHRYSFTSNANDSAGTAHGTAAQLSDANGPLGAPVEFSGGQAILDGVAGYIDLPNGIISSLTNISIETWVTVNASASWSRIFDFGNSTTGETRPDQAIGNGQNYMFLTPSFNGGGIARFAITDASNGAERPILSDTLAFPLGVETHVAVTYGQGSARFYIDGRLVAQGTAEIPLSALQDVNNWLGRSNWPDTFLPGSYNEFRIHNSILSGLEVKASSVGGADSVSYDPGTLSSLSITGEGTMLVGGTQTPQVTATFSVAGEAGLAVPDVTLASSAPSVVRVEANGSLTAVGIGNATITAAREGRNATLNIVVSPSDPAVLKHRYSFNEAAGSTTITDSVGGQNGVIMPPIEGAAALSYASGQLNFPGGAYTTAGYGDLPNGLISSKSNITIEVWATWNGPANSDWQRIFDFGDSQKGEDAQIPGNGVEFLFLTPRAGATGNPIRFDALNVGSPEIQLNRSPAMAVNVETHLVAVFAPTYRTSRLFLNGIPVAAGDAPFALSDLNDINNWLGASQWNDAPFNGRINELRIYEGPMTEVDVALSRHAGPDAVSPAAGALGTIAFQNATTLFLGDPAGVQAALVGNFANVANVNITGAALLSLASSDTNVFSLSAAGVLLPRNVGAATLSGGFAGKTATAAITVAGPTAIRHSVTNALVAGGANVNAALLASFPSAADVNVNAFAGVTRSSSNTNVVRIAANGNVTPVGPGTAVITSTYGGLTATTELTVAAPNYPRGVLVHRYSFSEAPDSTVVEDLVGSADGELVGVEFGSTNNNFTGTGQAALAGSAWNAAILGAYVNLPNGLISSLSSVTIEGWTTWRGGAANQRFFDFGMSSGAPDGAGGFGEDAVANPGRDYFFWGPSGSPGPRFAVRNGAGDAPNNPENPSLNSTIPIAQNVNTHYAVVYDPVRGVTRLYINGQPAGVAGAVFPLSEIDDRNAWLGRSVWGDPLYNGLIDEFRIYNGPLLDSEILASYQAGPNSLPDNTPVPRLSARIAGANIEILWPSASAGFSLETAPVLGGSWTAVGTAPVADGANMKVTVPLGTANAFYRLRK